MNGTSFDLITVFISH